MLRLAMAGDVMLGRLVDEFLSVNDPCYVWGDTLPLFRQADFAFCNLECAMTNRTKPWQGLSKAYYFRTHTQNAAALKCAGIKAVTLANNHALDYGHVGLEDTFVTLKENGIAYAGAGRDFNQAISPALFKVGGMTLGIVSFTDDMPQWAAQDDEVGIVHVPAPDSPLQQVLSQTIARAKDQADFLIVSPHWGPNWGYGVEPDFIDWAHAILDSGADMVFGHSGHVFRGVEIYKGKPVVYSAGDFVDDYAVNPDEPNNEGFLYVLELDGTRPANLKLYPTLIENLQARLAKGRGLAIMAKLSMLSESFKTQARLDSESNELTIPIRHG